jgi:hypothetical protein
LPFALFLPFLLSFPIFCCARFSFPLVVLWLSPLCPFCRLLLRPPSFSQLMGMHPPPVGAPWWEVHVGSTVSMSFSGPLTWMRSYALTSKSREEILFFFPANALQLVLPFLCCNSRSAFFLTKQNSLALFLFSAFVLPPIRPFCFGWFWCLFWWVSPWSRFSAANKGPTPHSTISSRQAVQGLLPVAAARDSSCG